MNGTAVHTTGGLKKTDIKKNKAGKYVSKAKSAQGEKQFSKLSKWNALVKKLYSEGSVKGPKGLTAAMKKAHLVYKK